MRSDRSARRGGHAARRGNASGSACRSGRPGPGMPRPTDCARARRTLRSRGAAGEARQIERVALELDDGRDRSCRSPAAARCRSISIRNVPRAGFDDLAVFGQRGDALVRIAPVVDEDAEQLPVGAPLADVEREAALDRDEAAGLHDVDDEIRLHLGGPVAQFAQALRRQIGADAERPAPRPPASWSGTAGRCATATCRRRSSRRFRNRC